MDKGTHTDMQEEFEDTKGVIRSRKLKKTHTIRKPKKMDKGTKTIYKTLHRKQKIEHKTNPTKQTGTELMCSGKKKTGHAPLA